MTRLPVEIEQDLVKATIDAGQWEICGFVLHDFRLVFMDNVAEHPGWFQMSDDALMDFYRQFGWPMGMFHSHPGGRREPSNSDIEYAPKGMRYWIITPSGAYEWDMTNGTPVLL